MPGVLRIVAGAAFKLNPSEIAWLVCSFKSFLHAGGCHGEYGGVAG